MNRAECYRILQLKPGANEATIRKQYKRLALKLHPDINPDPAAHEQFVQLSLAVEMLLKPTVNTHNTADSNSSKRSKRDDSMEEKMERMQEAKKRFEQQHARKMAEDNAYFQSLVSGIRWKIYKSVLWVGVVLSISLSLDAVLPNHSIPDELVAYQLGDHNGIFFNSISRIELKESGYHYAKNNKYAWNNTYPTVIVLKSWLLHTPISMISTDDYQNYTTGLDFHIGSIRWYLALLFLLPILPYLKQKKKLWFVFLYQFSFWGIGIIELYVLFTGSRILHLISLGFI